MENPQNTSTDIPSTPRPLGYWLRVVDRLLAREFETAFEAERVTRRDWRLLTLLDGDVVAPELSERLQRTGGKKLRGLIDRGWVTESGGAWTLTDEGRAAKERLGEAAAGIRAKVAAAVPAEDFTTTMTTLESIARELGWDPDERMPRGFGRRGFGPGRPGRGRRGFGPGHDGFGPGHDGFGPGHGFGRGFGAERGDDCRREAAHPGHPGHHGHHGRGARAAERAFERGFAAGFDRAGAAREA